MMPATSGGCSALSRRERTARCAAAAAWACPSPANWPAPCAATSPCPASWAAAAASPCACRYSPPATMLRPQKTLPPAVHLPASTFYWLKIMH
ncbi:hypothetical protein G6F59_016027 [Rhizopus arrhizus]|nr:hypothetical protein G6F59_016027 [Rhizopus arrhizus]